MSPRNLRSLLLLCLIALSAGWLAFIAFEDSQAIYIVKKFGYWLLLVNVGLFIGLLFKHFKVRCVDLRKRIQSRKWAIGYVILGACLLQLMQPHGYKIVMDEPVLASTALRMHEYKEVMTTARAHEMNGVFRQLDGYVDKRPLLYPFLVSILHDVTGYRSANPVILNGMLSLVFLGLLFYTGEQCWPKYGGYLSVLLFQTMPLLAMCATGAGFGMLNLVMILLTAQLAIMYLRDPSVGQMNLLIYSGLLLAQTRYESAAFVLPIAVIVLLGWIKVREIQINALTLCAPLLLVPFGLQRVIFDGSAAAYELREGASQAFSLAHMPGNLSDAFEFFFNLKTTEYPNSALLSVAFIVAVIVLLYALLRRRISVDLHCPAWSVALAFTAVVIFNFFLLMSYHWGQLNDIMATRIALPFMLFQVLLCTRMARMARMATNQAVGVKVGLGLIFCFFIGFTVPSAAKNDYLQWVPGRHEAIWVQEQSQAMSDQDVLLISNVHLMSIIERVPSIAQFWAKNNKAKLKLHLDLHTYEAIYIIYMMVADPGGGAGMIPETPVYRDYELELVAESKLGGKRFIRMSRIVDVNLVGREAELYNSLKRLPQTDRERLAFVAETLP